MTIRILALTYFMIFISCAGSSPKLDEGVKITPIKEFKDITVKPLETPSSDTAVSEAKKGPTPKPLFLAEVKKSKAGGKEKSVPLARQPELEDSAGFEGNSRRPIMDPFRVGEKVTMTLSYFNVSAGDAVMEIKPYVEVNGRKSYHFYATLKSSSLFSLFYTVDDFCEVYMDFNELVPYTFTLSAKETKQIRDVRIQFNWEKREAKFWEQKYTKDAGLEEKERTWKLTEYSQNIFSAIHYVRVFKLEVGKTYSYRVSDEAKEWVVKIHVERKEKIKTDIGEFDTVVVRPEVSIAGIFQPKGDVLFWYTDDDRHLPVKFESKIAIGTVVGKLKAIERGLP